MSSDIADDTDSRFDYKDSDWTAGGESGEFDGTSHSSTTAGAMVVFGPFQGAHSVRAISDFLIISRQSTLYRLFNSSV